MEFSNFRFWRSEKTMTPNLLRSINGGMVMDEGGGIIGNWDDFGSCLRDDEEDDDGSDCSSSSCWPLMSVTEASFSSLSISFSSTISVGLLAFTLRFPFFDFGVSFVVDIVFETKISSPSNARTTS